MTTAADTLIATLSEAEFQEMIVARARVRGWSVHHDRGDYRKAIAGDPGFPDLVLAKKGRVLFIEVKSARGGATDAQKHWLTQLNPGWDFPDKLDSELHVAIWRPADWPHIQQILDQEGTQ